MNYKTYYQRKDEWYNYSLKVLLFLEGTHYILYFAQIKLSKWFWLINESIAAFEHWAMQWFEKPLEDYHNVICSILLKYMYLVFKCSAFLDLNPMGNFWMHKLNLLTF